MLKTCPFKLPPLRKLPDKADLQAWMAMCDVNRRAILHWNSDFIPTISEGQPVYEYKYDMRSVRISPKNRQFFKDRMHPDDFKKYGLAADDSVADDVCVVDTDMLYRRIRYSDSEELEDREYRLMEEDKWQSE